MPPAIVLLAVLVGPLPKQPSLDLAGLVKPPASEARGVGQRFDADLGSLARTYPTSVSPTRHARLRKFYADWRAALAALDTKSLSAAGRDDVEALRARIAREARQLEERAIRLAAVAPLVPFLPTVIDLEDARRRIEPVDPVKAAATLAELRTRVARLRGEIETAFETDPVLDDAPLTRANLALAAETTRTLRAALQAWHGFFAGYDPLFTWWTAEPFREADAALGKYAAFLADAAAAVPAEDEPEVRPGRPARPAGPSDAPDLTTLLAEKPSELIPVIQRYTADRFGRGPGRPARGDGADRAADWLAALDRLDFAALTRDAQIDYLLLKNDLRRSVARRELERTTKDRPPAPRDASGIGGRPIGRATLLAELAGEMVPYTPEELIALAEKEYAWCEREVKQAAREMGFGDDWKRAVERVKGLHVEPGRQPYLIRDLAREAVRYVRDHDLVTVPPLCEETWRMGMLSPERQRVSPFFLGGEVIQVAFPTDAMSHELKLQSLRGNNAHFARATVHHELIPGHHLQGFQNARHKPYRGAFGTAVWTEGWATYWEMLLYARGDFARTPEDRVGLLVWRMHRCARVAFSFGFHLGKMVPQQCIDYLVDRVGFERENAAAEVRRSFTGGYGPVYQAAYLIGAMQFRALRKELVEGGKLTDRQFHDAVLRENRIPVELVRAALTGQPLAKDWKPGWRFAD